MNYNIPETQYAVQLIGPNEDFCSKLNLYRKLFSITSYVKFGNYKAMIDATMKYGQYSA